MTVPPTLDHDRATDHEAELIRAALALQADRAPRPDAVLAALAPSANRRRRTIRPGRGAAAGVAGLAAAAVVAGVAVAAGGRTAPVDAGTGTPGPATRSATAAADAAAAPLRYSPSWLPAGLSERQRELRVDAGGLELDRTWVPRTASHGEPGSERLDLLVRAAPDADLGSGTPVQVGGRPGVYMGGGPNGDKMLLQWQPRPGVWLTLVQSGLGLDRATLVRIAASMQPDAGVYGLPVDVGAAQRRGLVAAGTVVDGPRDWHAEVALRGVTVTLGTAPEPEAPTGGRTVQVGARQGRYVVGRDEETAWLVVPLAGGKVLTVAGRPQVPSAEAAKKAAAASASQAGGSGTSAGAGPVPSASELVAVAEAVDVSAVPDTSWGR